MKAKPIRERPKREPVVPASGTDVDVVNWKFGPKKLFVAKEPVGNANPLSILSPLKVTPEAVVAEARLVTKSLALE
jgi:hypothetical protein